MLKSIKRLFSKGETNFRSSGKRTRLTDPTLIAIKQDEFEKTAEAMAKEWLDEIYNDPDLSSEVRAMLLRRRTRSQKT